MDIALTEEKREIEKILSDVERSESKPAQASGEAMSSPQGDAEPCSAEEEEEVEVDVEPEEEEADASPLFDNSPSQYLKLFSTCSSI